MAKLDRNSTDHTIERTRTSQAWAAAAVGLLLLLVALVFVVQNGGNVEVSFLVWDGTIMLGVALLLAAVLGGLTVLLLGMARQLQLRRTARRHRRMDEGSVERDADSDQARHSRVDAAS